MGTPLGGEFALSGWRSDRLMVSPLVELTALISINGAASGYPPSITRTGSTMEFIPANWSRRCSW